MSDSIRPSVDSSYSRFSLNSKLGKVLKDPEGFAVLERHLPGIANDPSTKLGYGMKLKLIFSMTSTVTKEMQAAIEKDLKAIN